MTIAKDSDLEMFPQDQLHAALSVLCGERLGYGISRTTFAMRYCDDKVLKIENADSGVFQNVIEWRAWEYIQHDTEMLKYFIPCVEISRCGTVLVQMKAEALPDDMHEVELPDFVGDYKRENLGMFEGRVVVLDYGLWNPVARGKVKIKKRMTY